VLISKRMEKELLQRITLNPKVCFGKPTIRNMRYPVETMLDLMSAGMTIKEILEDYPDLEEADLQACLLFASKLVKVNSINKIIHA
jgi:uncharacterized protein (DUF433 family)